MSRLSDRLRRLRRQAYQAWGQQYLARMGALTPLRTFVAQRPPGAYPPEYHDLAYLYRAILRDRRRVVLEFGSGCSTLVMALALQRLGTEARLVSLESDPAWEAQTWQALPVALRGWCTLTTSALVPDRWHNLCGYRYAARPATLVPDLIYLDGPGLTPAHAALQGLCALDLLRLEPRLRRGCHLVVDGRPGTTAFLRQHFQRWWEFRRDHVMDRHVFTLQREERL